MTAGDVLMVPSDYVIWLCTLPALGVSLRPAPHIPHCTQLMLQPPIHPYFECLSYSR